jgi:hypothetical protein
VPGDRGIDIGEGARAHHEGLGRAAFLGRATVIADPSRRSRLGQPVLERRRRKQRRRTEKIVAAAMTVAARLQLRRVVDAGHLAQPRKRVVFAEDGDDRAAFARLSHHGGGNARDAFGHAEPLVAQHRRVFGAGPVFVVKRLGDRPDAVGQADQVGCVRVDDIPDRLFVAHLDLRCPRAHE